MLVSTWTPRGCCVCLEKSFSDHEGLSPWPIWWCHPVCLLCAHVCVVYTCMFTFQSVGTILCFVEQKTETKRVCSYVCCFFFTKLHVCVCARPSLLLSSCPYTSVEVGQVSVNWPTLAEPAALWFPLRAVNVWVWSLCYRCVCVCMCVWEVVRACMSYEHVYICVCVCPI